MLSAAIGLAVEEDGQHQHAAWIEPRINPGQAPDALQQQGRADQEDDGHGHLRDDHAVVGAKAPAIGDARGSLRQGGDRWKPQGPTACGTPDPTAASRVAAATNASACQSSRGCDARQAGLRVLHRHAG